ncbi:MAG: elongation factor P maturation arginine rhamnosyltransferase EarP [Thiohalomonadaceae bacterium]
MPAPRWDIFCSVVDNFGDIGICWRLARQLAGEHGLNVRLWVDDLAAFRRINPEIDPDQDVQRSRGVEARRWLTPFPAVTPQEVAAVVLDTFACTPPEAYLRAMAACEPKPRWVNVEHLSAEDWVAGCHGLPSPQPGLPLTKYFFFPGFSAGTGGLLRERGLLEARRAFQGDAAAQADFWAGLSLPPADGDLRLTLFAYDCVHITPLLHHWEHSSRPLRVLVPEGALARRIGARYGAAEAAAGAVLGAGALTVHVLPFIEQDRYDRLLWACDVNFVRGEDSFVRAQWAGRPLVWQPYRQQEDAHSDKLNAFLHRYCAGLGAQEGAVLRDLWQAWNREEGMAQHWDGFLAHRAAYTAHAELWARQMSALGDLAANLVAFCHQGKAR